MGVGGSARRGFIKVAVTSDLVPGTMRTFSVAGKRILLANVEGNFYATDDTCTHATAALVDGDLDGNEVMCPLHGSTFDVTTGEATTAPATEPLAVYPVLTEGSDVLILLEETDPTI